MGYSGGLVSLDLTRKAVVRRLDVRRLLRPVAVLAYAGFAATVLVSVGGVPSSRDTLVALLLGGVLAASVGSVARLRRFAVGLAVDWLPLLLALWAYDLARGLGSRGWFPVHYAPQIRLDRLIGAGSIPTVWLQQHLWHGAAHIAWYDYASLAVYTSYFLVTPVALVALWWFSPSGFRRFAVGVVTLALFACLTFLVYPAAPPWLAAQHGLIPPVHQLVGTINRHLPLIRLDPLWERGTGYANIVASVPSLHAGQTLFVTLFFTRRLRSPLRHLLWLYPLAMAFALVYTGEHYVGDVVLGWAYCVAVYVALERGFARRTAVVELGRA